MIITPGENGVSDCTCKEGDFAFSYFTGTQNLCAIQSGFGRMTGKSLTIHCFTSESERDEKIEELGLSFPIEED